jgi:hypothetical protein
VELAERGDVTGVCPRVARPTTRWTERQAGSALEAIKAYERNVKVRPRHADTWAVCVSSVSAAELAHTA